MLCPLHKSLCWREKTDVSIQTSDIIENATESNRPNKSTHLKSNASIQCIPDQTEQVIDISSKSNNKSTHLQSKPNASIEYVQQQSESMSQIKDTDVTIYRISNRKCKFVNSNGDKTNAVIDTITNYNVMSNKDFRSLQHCPKKTRDIKMKHAGKIVTGFVVGPVKFRMGSIRFEEEVYIVPIDEDAGNLLFGLDIEQ